MATEEASPLMDLPAELRIGIYHNLLVHDNPIQVDKHDFHRESFSIFNVSKQITQEAKPIFWSENTFHTIAKEGNSTTAIDWLEKIGAANASRIRKFLIEYTHSRRVLFQATCFLRARPQPIDVGRLLGEIDDHVEKFLGRETDVVNRMHFMFQIGLSRGCLLVVPPSPVVSSDIDNVLNTVHLAFNRKIEQLRQTTGGDKA